MGMGHLYRIKNIINGISASIGGTVRANLLTRDYSESKNIYTSFQLDQVYEMSPDISEAEEISFIKNELKDKYKLIINDQLKSSERIAECLVKRGNCTISLDDTGEGSYKYDRLINVLYCNYPALDNETNSFEYLILPNLQPIRDAYSLSAKVRRIFINQGAADTWGGIPDIINDLNGLKDRTILKILLGPAFRHYAELANALSKTKHKIELHYSTDSVASLAMDADLAILGAGNTLFEVVSIGVPTVTCTREPKEIITINRLLEEKIIHGMKEIYEKNTIVGIIEELIDSYDERRRLHYLGRKIFSYNGLQNIVDGIKEMI